MRGSAPLALLALAAYLWPGGSALAQQSVPLALKFAAGEVTQYEIAISGEGSISAAEGELTSVTFRGAFTVVQKVTQVLSDSSGRLESTIPRGDVIINFGSEQVRFSYANGRLRWYANGRESSPPQTELSRLPLIGSALVCTMAPDGRVSGVALADPRMPAGLAKAAPGLAQSPSLSETVFPSQVVRVGETWSSTTQLTPLGPGFPVTCTSSRTLESLTEGGGMALAKIVGFTEARYRGPSAPLFSAQELSLAISDIRQTITSTEFFNSTAGRLIRAEYDLVFSTAVSAAAGGQQKNAGIKARLRIGVQAR
jgi:hypothetical protein